MLKRDTIGFGIPSLRGMLRTIPMFNYFRVNMCGNLTVPSDWRIGPRIINDFHLLMVLGGKGKYTVDGVDIPLRRGMIIFVSNGVEYSAEQDLSDPLHIVPVRFFIYDNRTDRPSGILKKGVAIGHATSNIEKYRQMFESLHRQHLLNRGPFRTGYCSTIIHHILCDLLLESSEYIKGNALGDDRIARVQDFIAMNPTDRSSVTALARMARLSTKYFTRLFRQQTGITPKRYQLNSRLSQARVLLENGASVKEAAFQMGYPDQYIFSKQFKVLLGISPSEVRHN